MNDFDLRLAKPKRALTGASRTPIGALLLDDGKIAQDDLRHALALQERIDAPLGDIMVAEGLVSKRDVLGALAVQACTDQAADPLYEPPALQMARHLPAALCLRYGVVPWREDGNEICIATSSPDAFSQLRQALGPRGKNLVPVIAEEARIQSQISRLYGSELAAEAAQRVPARESCRGWEDSRRARLRWSAAILGVCTAMAVFIPAYLITVLTLIATVTLLMTTVLKLAALIAHVTPAALPAKLAAVRPSDVLNRLKPAAHTPQTGPELTLLSGPRAGAALRIAGETRKLGIGALPFVNAGEKHFRMPRVSVLVPLLREREIASQLISRLSRLTYPKSLLEVVLVLEASDTLTRETIARTTLPEWMRVIEVPEAGNLTTKPRALNYALDFCRGSIIGVWDAEDWPEADQIEKVVTRFQQAPPETACIQGVLDYYNSRTNWLTRCFSIEYASWWRVFLPGIARMGLVVPLGGTTLFFRRRALEDLGGWDAHNVTEDADLGLRLARHGYMTELLPTVTHEEATSRAWPWIRQRSRWLKGFLITYCVHMRDVRQLWRDLGPARFFGVQTLFFATVTQFALAPVLWSFWFILAGLGHPISGILGQTTVTAMIALFILSAVLTLAAGVIATADKPRRHLIPFVPTMGVYFALGTLAAYKALWELIRAPFYWDKTQHGVTTCPAAPDARGQLSS
ncbi:glycosyltransferase family 2 protein [uncultured Roseobacter sp.]|uniref:glycosyltransferase family 2 protein n=1 Tax=uncultured Roseobacter sp. TaxID=114847 RepID=UPI00260B3C8E|nr:glycosyltransferase family 2 protein [uncultured Roseobacter sp.]